MTEESRFREAEMAKGDRKQRRAMCARNNAKRRLEIEKMWNESKKRYVNNIRFLGPLQTIYYYYYYYYYYFFFKRPR